MTPDRNTDDREKLVAQWMEDELADYRMVLHHCATIYEAITGGRISKPNTLPEEVLVVANDLEEERTNEAIAEATTDLLDLVRRLVAYHEMTGTQLMERSIEDQERDISMWAEARARIAGLQGGGAMTAPPEWAMKALQGAITHDGCDPCPICVRNLQKALAAAHAAGQREALESTATHWERQAHRSRTAGVAYSGPTATTYEMFADWLRARAQETP